MLSPYKIDIPIYVPGFRVRGGGPPPRYPPFSELRLLPPRVDLEGKSNLELSYEGQFGLPPGAWAHWGNSVYPYIITLLFCQAH